VPSRESLPTHCACCACSTCRAALEDIRSYFHNDFSLLQYNTVLPWESGSGSSSGSSGSADGGSLEQQAQQAQEATRAVPLARQSQEQHEQQQGQAPNLLEQHESGAAASRR